MYAEYRVRGGKAAGRKGRAAAVSCQRTERQRLASGTSALLKYSSTTITTAVLKMLRFTAEADPKKTSCSSEESAGSGDRRERCREGGGGGH